MFSLVRDLIDQMDRRAPLAGTERLKARSHLLTSGCPYEWRGQRDVSPSVWSSIISLFKDMCLHIIPFTLTKTGSWTGIWYWVKCNDLVIKTVSWNGRLFAARLCSILISRRPLHCRRWIFFFPFPSFTLFRPCFYVSEMFITSITIPHLCVDMSYI